MALEFFFLWTSHFVQSSFFMSRTECQMPHPRTTPLDLQCQYVSLWPWDFFFFFFFSPFSYRSCEVPLVVIALFDLHTPFTPLLLPSRRGDFFLSLTIRYIPENLTSSAPQTAAGLLDIKSVPPFQWKYFSPGCSSALPVLKGSRPCFLGRLSHFPFPFNSYT